MLEKQNGLASALTDLQALTPSPLSKSHKAAEILSAMRKNNHGDCNE